jgi:hypothetical protein
MSNHIDLYSNRQGRTNEMESMEELPLASMSTERNGSQEIGSAEDRILMRDLIIQTIPNINHNTLQNLLRFEMEIFQRSGYSSMVEYINMLNQREKEFLQRQAAKARKGIPVIKLKRKRRN